MGASYCLCGLDGLHGLDSWFFFVRDAELSGQVQTEPGSFPHAHLQGSTTVGNSTDNLSESPVCSLMPPILLSVCGGLGDDGELSHGMSEGGGGIYALSIL